MASLSDHFGFDDLRQFAFTICFSISSCILLMALCAFFLIIWRVEEIGESLPGGSQNSFFRSKSIKIYCSHSVFCALIFVMAKFSNFLVCARWDCAVPKFYMPFGILRNIGYCLSHFFFHMALLCRLLNPHHRAVHGELKYTAFTLKILLFVLFISVLVMTFADIKDSVQWYQIQSIGNVVYVTSDLVLSIMTTILFFRPFCSIQGSSSLIHQVPAMMLVMKYAKISAIQLVVTTVCDVVFVINEAYIARDEDWTYGVNDVQATLSMLDCFIVMLCIYYGFVSRQTDPTFREYCNYYCYRYCCRKRCDPPVELLEEEFSRKEQDAGVQSSVTTFVKNSKDTSKETKETELLQESTYHEPITRSDIKL